METRNKYPYMFGIPRLKDHDMKTFNDYLREASKEYKFKIKIAHGVTEDTLNIVEKMLRPYDGIVIGKPQKTIFQTNPMDFPELKSSEVWIIQISTRLPISSYMLRKILHPALGLPESLLVVRSDEEPLELQNDAANAKLALDDVMEKKDLSPAPLMSTEPFYPEVQGIGEPAFGDAYNSKLLQYIAAVRQEKAKEQPVEEEKKLFTWLSKTIKDESGQKIEKGKDELPAKVSRLGNFTSSSLGLPVTKKVQDKKGKEEVIVAKEKK